MSRKPKPTHIYRKEVYDPENNNGNTTTQQFKPFDYEQLIKYYKKNFPKRKVEFFVGEIVWKKIK